LALLFFLSFLLIDSYGRFKEQLHREVGASGALVLCLRYLAIPTEHRQDLQLNLFSWQDKQDIFITLTKVEKEVQAPAPSPPDKPRQRPARSGKVSWLSRNDIIPLVSTCSFNHPGWDGEPTPDPVSVCIDVIEGSLEVKLPTIWTDEAAEVGRGREEKES